MKQKHLKKRGHPDGFVLWDVRLDDMFVGTVRQHAVTAPSWFAYGPHGQDCGRFATRRDAVDALTNPLGKTVGEWVQDVQNGVNNFAADMREKEIHVGLGSPPACVICGIWPCNSSLTNQPAKEPTQ